MAPQRHETLSEVSGACILMFDHRVRDLRAEAGAGERGGNAHYIRVKTETASVFISSSPRCAEKELDVTPLVA